MAAEPAVSVLDADPDLGAGLAGEALATARRELVVATRGLPRGSWAPDDGEPPGGALGLLVLEGLLTRSLTLGGRTTTELLGAGDVLRPWEHADLAAPVPAEHGWCVLVPATLALLDRRFTAAAGHYPEVVAAIAGRMLGRSRALVLQSSLRQVPRVDGRVLLLLWQLAERWGRVGPDGVLVPLRLTHETLGELVGARRPSVTTALTHLAELGLVTRRADGWLLERDPGPHLDALLRLPGGASGEEAA